MGDVVHTDAFERAAHVQRFCRLAGIVERNTEAVLADPLKYLGQASDEIARLQQALRDVRDALRPMPVYEPEGPIRYMDITAETHKRNMDALRVVNNALTTPTDPKGPGT